MDIVIDTKIEVIFEVIVTQIILLEIDLDRKVHRANIAPWTLLSWNFRNTSKMKYNVNPLTVVARV